MSIGRVEIRSWPGGFTYKIGRYESHVYDTKGEAERASQQVQELVHGFWKPVENSQSDQDETGVLEGTPLANLARRALLSGFLDYIYGGSNAVPQQLKIKVEDFLDEYFGDHT